MSLFKRWTFALAVMGMLGLVAGCSGTGNPRFGGYDDEPQPGYEQQVEDQGPMEPQEPTQADIDGAIQESEQNVREQLGLGTWSCALDVTYNDDWHDDVLCSNGVDAQRPYLREWDDFVEEWEILESAEEYEVQLNAGG